MILKKKVLVMFILISFLINNTKAINRYYVELKPESTLKIYGTTNINSFSLIYFLKNSPIVLHPFVNVTDSCYSIAIADVQIPLRSFKADNSQIKQDFLELIKERQYPEMTISVKNFYVLTKDISNNHSTKKGAASIAITLGGITKFYNIQFLVNGNDNALFIEGHQELNIRDFNLEPPTKFFGLIKVNEMIEIDFDLNVRLVQLT